MHFHNLEYVFSSQNSKYVGDPMTIQNIFLNLKIFNYSIIQNIFLNGVIPKCFQTMNG